MVVNASAQYWEPAGIPYHTGPPSVVYTDTVHDRLLAMAQFPIVIDGFSYLSLFSYDGLHWDTLGYFGNQVHCAVVYHDTLLVAGVFPYMQSGAIASIAAYAGGNWHPYGEFLDNINEAALVQKLRVVDGVLYAVGIFETADGQYCNGLAKRVGGHWEPLPGWGDLELTENTRAQDIIRYQGRLVVGGKFHNLDMSLMNLLQYDGTAWVPVCAGCLHGGLDGVAALAEYQGDLYVGGISYYGSGNAGQGIMRWDGENMYGLGLPGDGLQNINYSDQYSPDIFDLQVRDGLLYLGGAFMFVDHVATPAGICTWDGTDFCLLEGEPFSTYFAPFDFYHDTLYGATGGVVPDPDLIGLVRYTGELCATTTGVGEEPSTAVGLQLTWSSSEELTVGGLSDGPHRVQVFDAQGRLVLERMVRSNGGHSEALRWVGPGSALYLVVVDGYRTARLLPLR